VAKMIDELQAKLDKEFKEAEHELKVVLPKEIRKATDMGDLSENAEYKAALERQEFLKARLEQLLKRLRELSMLNVDRLPRDRVAFGTRMNVFDMEKGTEMEFTLVMPEDADLKLGLISLSSPLGRGFIGKSEGDEARIETPGGTRNFEILDLKTIHDQED
jgi:transcription elongation factor GreA